MAIVFVAATATAVIAIFRVVTRVSGHFLGDQIRRVVV
jgi:hypothetical protein